MTTPQATSLTLLPAPANLPRALPPDDQARSVGGWQQAFQAAAQDGEPAPAGLEEAARMLALGNLALLPAQALPLPLASHAGTSVGAGAVVGDVAYAPHAVAVTTPAAVSVRAVSKTLAARFEHAPNAVGMPANVSPAGPAESQAAQCGATGRDVAARLSGSSSSGRPLTLPSSDTSPQPAVARPVNAAPETTTRQAIASYAAAMSAAPSPAERAADFALFDGSSTLPVRIHVQWRDRVADVWIGLHRQAFNQLPDIRAGVVDWVHSRGGVLGRVVCNGEALGRVAPSVSFLGDL